MAWASAKHPCPYALTPSRSAQCVLYTRVSFLLILPGWHTTSENSVSTAYAKCDEPLREILDFPPNCPHAPSSLDANEITPRTALLKSSVCTCMCPYLPPCSPLKCHYRTNRSVRFFHVYVQCVHPSSCNSANAITAHLLVSTSFRTHCVCSHPPPPLLDASVIVARCGRVLSSLLSECIHNVLAVPSSCRTSMPSLRVTSSRNLPRQQHVCKSASSLVIPSFVLWQPKYRH